ncbi:MAG: hypothetical protein V1866_03110 [archaeon]
MKSKKAMAMESLVALIIIIAVTLFVLLYYLKEKNKYDVYSDREVCRESALAQSISTYVEGSGDLVSLSCPTNNIQFFNNHVEKNGKTLVVRDVDSNKNIKKFKQLDDKIVDQVLAEEMRWCWYQFLEGQKELFSRNLLGAGLRGVLSDAYAFCYICDEVYFDESISQADFGTIKQYLMKTKMPNTELTYYNYTMKNPASKCDHFKDEAEKTSCWEGYFEEHINEENEFKGQESFYEPGGYAKLQTSVPYVIAFVRIGKPAKVLTADLSYVVNILRTETLPVTCDSFVRGGAE